MPHYLPFALMALCFAGPAKTTLKTEDHHGKAIAPSGATPSKEAPALSAAEEAEMKKQLEILRKANEESVKFLKEMEKEM